MDKSQNTISILILFALATSTVISTGCKLGTLPKMPEMPIFKKDSFKLSRSGNESIAPPSRTFDPKPSHFADLDSANSNSNFEAASSETVKPSRKPYEIAQSNDDGGGNFGFPKGAKSLFGNEEKGSEFSMPDSEKFKQAMNNSAQEFEGFANRSQEAAAETFDKAKEFVSNSAKSASDFAQGGGDFVARGSQQLMNQSQEFAQNAWAGSTESPKWNSDFKMSEPEMKKPEPLANRLIGNDFDASVKKASQDAKRSMAEFNQRAMSQVNEGIQSTKQAANEFVNSNPVKDRLNQAAGQFEQTWQKSVEQAKQTTQAIRDSAPAAQQQVAQTGNLGGFRPRGKQPSATESQSFAKSSPAISQPNTRQQAIEVTPQVEFNRSQTAIAREPALNQPQRRLEANTTGSQFASTDSGQFQGSQTRNPAPKAPATIQQVRQSGNQRYPSTNYSAYGNQGPTRVSQVTPLSGANKSIASQPATSQPAARTAGLPSELLQGNSAYAPGSVKKLSPIR